MKPKKDNRLYPHYKEQVDKLLKKFDKPMLLFEYILALSDWTVSPPTGEENKKKRRNGLKG